MEQVLRLPDGRAMALAEHGDPNGRPVFLFHGTPACRLGHEFTDEPARQRGIRVLCPDRPGIGRSDPKPGRNVADWGDDVGALADVAGIDTFAVLGYSCGGPYALAAAARLPDRVTTAGLMAGVGPIDRPGAREGLAKSDLQLLDLSAKRPWAAGLLLRALRTGARLAPKAAVKSFKKELGEADGRAIDAQGDPRGLMAFFIESMAQGPSGVVDEYRVWGTVPWGFALEDVRVPVHIWQGDADQMVPMAHADDMAARLPDATLHRLAGEGHVSIQHHIGEILDSISPA